MCLSSYETIHTAQCLQNYAAEVQSMCSELSPANGIYGQPKKERGKHSKSEDKLHKYEKLLNKMRKKNTSELNIWERRQQIAKKITLTQGIYPTDFLEYSAFEWFSCLL